MAGAAGTFERESSVRSEAISLLASGLRYALLGSAFAAVAASSALADTTKVGGVYSVTVSGIRFAEARFSLIVQNNAYSAKLDMSSSGLGRLFSSGHGTASSAGWFKRARVKPSRYSLSSKASKKRATRVSMNLSQGTVRNLSVKPELRELPDRVPVTSRHKRNITDPLSAILMPVKGKRASLDSSACRRTIPVFDGWTRYDVKFGYKGTREVHNADYTGKVVVCSARWVPVAGHRPKKASVKKMAANRSMEVWLAPVGKLPLFVPYRISMTTGMGSLVVEARRLRMMPEQRQAAR